jgi:hypothetical protein
MSDLLNFLGGLATIPAALAGLLLLVMLFSFLSLLVPTIPGPRRPLRVPPFIIVWPEEAPEPTPDVSWHRSPIGAAALLVVALPGAVWFLAQPSENHLNLRIARIVCELVGGLVLAWLCVSWMEWLARFAAMKKRVGLVLLVPAIPVAIYAMLCRVFGSPAVDHTLLGAVGWMIVLPVIGLVCFVLFWIGLYLQAIPLVGVWLVFKAIAVPFKAILGRLRKGSGTVIQRSAPPDPEGRER